MAVISQHDHLTAEATTTEYELNWRSHFVITPVALCNLEIKCKRFSKCDIFVKDAMLIKKCDRPSVEPVG